MFEWSDVKKESVSFIGSAMADTGHRMNAAMTTLMILRNFAALIRFARRLVVRW